MAGSVYMVILVCILGNDPEIRRTLVGLLISNFSFPT